MQENSETYLTRAKKVLIAQADKWRIPGKYLQVGHQNYTINSCALPALENQTSLPLLVAFSRLKMIIFETVKSGFSCTKHKPQPISRKGCDIGNWVITT